MSSEFPAEWTEVPLADMCARVSVGYVGETSSHYTEGTGIALIRSQNVRPNRLDLSEVKQVTEKFHEESKKSQLVAGDLLIVRVGQNRGDCAVLPPGLGEVNCANIVFARPARNYSDFFGAYFNTPRGHDALLSVSSGSAQLVLNTNAVAKIKVPVPPPNEALAIGTLSRHFEERIALLRETNATLEAIAQALFKSWFVDFDPVRAKMEGRAPEGMDEVTAALFPDSFEESELGLVPRGWRVGVLTEISKISSGNRPNVRSDAMTDAALIPLFGGAGIMGFTNEALFQVRKILTGRVGTLGKVHIAYPPFWASDNVLVLSPEESRNFLYCFHWLKSIDVHSLNRGSTQPLLTQKDLGKQQHVIPTEAVLSTFAAIAEVIYETIRENSQQAQTLATLRDTLLPRLISGQLRLA